VVSAFLDFLRALEQLIATFLAGLIGLSQTLSKGARDSAARGSIPCNSAAIPLQIPLLEGVAELVL
jgi:hypothetical protein